MTYFVESVAASIAAARALCAAVTVLDVEDIADEPRIA